MALDWQKGRAAALVANQPFFDLVYRNLRGMVAIVTRDETGKLNSERWFPADQIESARQYSAARHDEDVYFSVSAFPPSISDSSRSSRESTSESLCNVVYADADTCKPSNFRLPPTITVETSPGRWHCLWVLDHPLSGQLAGELSAKVSTAHAAQGCDKHAKDTKILRVPGTTNTKYGLPHLVTATYIDRTYTYAEFAAAYEDVVVVGQSVVQASGDLKLDVYTPEQIAQLETYAEACWSNALSELTTEASLGWDGQGWDNVAYRVACKLARIAAAPWTRYTRDNVVSEMDKSPMNDEAFRASEKCERAFKDIGIEYLQLPDWALAYQNVELPNIGDTDYAALEERIDRAGLTQWYVSVPQRGDANKVVIDFIDRCRDMGFENTDTYAIVSNSNVFKNLATLTPEYLWLALTGGGRDEIEVPDIPMTRRDWSDIPPFLTTRERDWCLSNPAWPDEYVEWVKSTGTDAATVYQRTLAFSILSAVYGDIAFLREHFSDPRLNFYIQVLGDSTLTRKTTAMHRALVVIQEFEERTGKTIELTSNATSEALVKALAENGDSVKMMWTDEIQGYLDEMNNKRYLAGFLGTLAKLYDGKVEASLRIGKESGNVKSQVTFNFVGVGIRKHVANTLTTKNYESGLMPRFVWAVADPPPFTKTMMDVELDPPQRGDSYGKYSSIVDVVTKMVRNRRKIGEDQFQPVTVSREANQRFNEMGHIVASYLLSSGQVDYLSAAVSRFGTSVRKAAALLALHDGSLEVSLSHMLHAIRQAEFWFRDMVRMANEVAATDFERQVDEMEKYLVDGPRNRRPYSDVRNRFKGLRAQDFQEILANLTARGRAKYDQKTGVITAFVV
jgi:hypothetical protein